MRCAFCDCPSYGFYGNVSTEELAYEIRTILENENVKHTRRFNVHFARMGEPSFNLNVLTFTQNLLIPLVKQYITTDTIHPVVSTMMPNTNPYLENFLRKWCEIKNDLYEGEAGLQLSINSTNDMQRKTQFNGRSHSLIEISKIAEKLPTPIGRKYTLNFAVTADTELDPVRLSNLFDKDRFIVKITPIHQTKNAVENGFDVGDSYTDYNVYRDFERPLVKAGWDVIVFVPSKEEDSDRITCGNALIAIK